MELTPEEQYRPHYPGAWRVGDLLRNVSNNSQLLVIRVFSDQSPAALANAPVTIATDGTVTCGQIGQDWLFSHHTGLLYEFTSSRQAQRDFENGMFTPYFEIL